MMGLVYCRGHGLWAIPNSECSTPAPPNRPKLLHTPTCVKQHTHAQFGAHLWWGQWGSKWCSRPQTGAGV